MKAKGSREMNKLSAIAYMRGRCESLLYNDAIAQYITKEKPFHELAEQMKVSEGKLKLYLDRSDYWDKRFYVNFTASLLLVKG
jgi:hypothetical protein